MISELDLIRRIKALSNPHWSQAGALSSPRCRRTGAQVAPAATTILKGIGDDCAVLAHGQAATLTLITTDTLVEGVHFDLSWHPPELLGHKAVAVNVSDIAGMGGVPRFALLSLAAAATFNHESLERFLHGFMVTLAEYQVSLIGGDTVRSDQGLVLSVTLLGEVDQRQVVYRNGAKPGDQIWVSGFLGQAAAGLEICRQRKPRLQQTYPELMVAHLNPSPELALGRALAESGLVSAMIDMSDGLASDLAHICEESEVGALVYAEELPISEDSQQVARALGLDPLRLALAGGEDYRLLFTAPSAAKQKIQALAYHAVHGKLVMVGQIVEGQGIRLSTAGQERALDLQGYDHFAAPQNLCNSISKSRCAREGKRAATRQH